MKWLIYLIVALGWCGPGLVPPAVSAVTVELVPDMLTVHVGDLVDVDVVAAGLEGDGPPSVGAFDIDLAFDPSLLSPVDVVFGPFLGDPDPLAFQALTDFNFFASTVALAEVSLLSPAELDDLQPGSFVLATVSFLAIGDGTTTPTLPRIRVDDAFGDKLVLVPWPGPLALLATGLAVLARRRRPRTPVGWLFLAMAAAGAAAGPAAAAEPEFKDLLDPKTGQKTGISYTLGKTELVSGDDDPDNKKFFNTAPCPNPNNPRLDGLPCNLKTPLVVKNANRQDQRVIMCLTGVTPELGGEATFKHLQINMKVDANQFDCELPVAQNLPASKRRNGAMGCQLVTVPACATKEVLFTSGNARTIPKVTDGKIVAGQFERVGPPQKGEVGGATIATGAPLFGQIGGHPVMTRGDPRKRVGDVLGDAFIDFILLDDPQLGLRAEANRFNCNKCFGMMPNVINEVNRERKVVLEAHGYLLKLPEDAVLQNLKVTVIREEAKYTRLELKKGAKSSGEMNLYSESTYAGELGVGSIPAFFRIVDQLPPGCALGAISPSEEVTFSLLPGEQKTGTFEVTCDASLAPGARGQLIVSLLRADRVPAEILAEHWIRLISPLACDFNDDGVVDTDDIHTIFRARDTPADPGDPLDVDRDGLVTVNDARVCTLRCTNPRCAPAVSSAPVCP